MSKPTVPDLKELFKQASEIAQQVSESMQDAAFNRAIDLLTGGTNQKLVVERKTPKGSSRGKTSKQSKVEEENSSEKGLLSVIDSTQHPGVTSAAKVLDRALMVLQIALDDHSVDGLRPSNIAKILTDKFRVSTTHNAVSMALGNATELVNRVSEGQGYLYKIMALGKEYLAHLGEAKAPTTSPPKKKRTKRKATIQSVNSKDIITTEKPKVSKGGGKKTQTKGKVGPKAAVVSLIDSGFFSKGQTGPSVQAHLNDKRGFSFGIHQLRLAMLRLVREENLDRDRNEEGQYEYKKP